MKTILRIGSRGSMLALWQANWVKQTIEAKLSHLSVEIRIIKTKGDKILDVPLAKIGGKGLFVKEIEEALLENAVDIAVHSMKDMPGDIPAGLCIGAIPERENPFDVLISARNICLKDLKSGARIGTSSLRRSAQLLHMRPDLNIVPLRGNLDTRLKKLDARELDAIILAAAGVRRLGLEGRITEYLSEDVLLPAVGQGALCIEIRCNDALTATAVAGLDHVPTRRVVLGERAFLRRLQGGCQVPIAAHGKTDGTSIFLRGLVASLDGKNIIRDSVSGPESQAESLGVQLAERLLSKGADRLLNEFLSAMETPCFSGTDKA
ncbi:MAG: hydroxymethylbilane synthase [Deltaproteobacteria bacterium]|nr:hydroxymethylbilane synthase [Deltaproteobacteria bacterium]